MASEASEVGRWAALAAWDDMRRGVEPAIRGLLALGVPGGAAVLELAERFEAFGATLRGWAVDGAPVSALVHFAGFVQDAPIVPICAGLEREGDEAWIVGVPARVTCRVCAERLAAMGRR